MLKSNTIIKDYQIEQLHGKGASGQVYLVKPIQDNHKFAMKIFNLDFMNQKEKEMALQEVKILRSLYHPNIIEYIDHFLQDNGTTLCLVMEYAEGI